MVVSHAMTKNLSLSMRVRMEMPGPLVRKLYACAFSCALRVILFSTSIYHAQFHDHFADNLFITTQIHQSQWSITKSMVKGRRCCSCMIQDSFKIQDLLIMWLIHKGIYAQQTKKKKKKERNSSSIINTHHAQESELQSAVYAHWGFSIIRERHSLTSTHNHCDGLN